MTKQVRNQYTGAAGLTQREADTIYGCHRKLFKIAQKKNLYVGHVRRLITIVEEMEALLREAER